MKPKNTKHSSYFEQLQAHNERVYRRVGWLPGDGPINEAEKQAYLQWRIETGGDWYDYTESDRPCGYGY